MNKIFACTLIIIGVVSMAARITSSSKNSTLLPYRRIIDGYRSDIRWVPYYVYVALKDGIYTRSCGGSIISSRWVLTAAHCLFKQRTRIDNDDISLYAGTSVSNVYEGYLHLRHVIYSMVHINWPNPRPDRIASHDIALLMTCSDWEYNDAIRPISVAPKNYVLPDGIVALACGFGDTRTFGPSITSRDLYAVRLRKRRCWDDSPSQTVICFDGIHSTQSGICTGDSGGPLMYLDRGFPILIGVATGTGCKENVAGSSFTDVSLYRDWIRDVAGI